MTIVRDNRALSRLDPRLRDADKALDDFGRMYLNDSPRPWSRTTMLGRCIEFGNQGAAQSSAPPTHIAPNVVIVDKAFALWTLLRQRIVLTIYAWKRAEPQEIQRRHAKVSEHIFKHEHRYALEVVCDRLAEAALA